MGKEGGDGWTQVICSFNQAQRNNSCLRIYAQAQVSFFSQPGWWNLGVTVLPIGHKKEIPFGQNSSPLRREASPRRWIELVFLRRRQTESKAWSHLNSFSITSLPGTILLLPSLFSLSSSAIHLPNVFVPTPLLPLAIH